MRARRRRLRALLLLLVGTGLTGLVLMVALTDAFRQMELDTVDGRFSIRGQRTPSGDIITVNIDDVTFDTLDKRWPFPRRMHAAVIDRLRRAGASVIAYDIQFTEPSERQEDDTALMRSVARARGRVVLATTEVNEFGESDVFGGDEKVRELGARVGNAMMPADVDGVIRRVPYAIDGMLGFALQTAELQPFARNRFTHGSAWIDYHGPPGAIPGVSFSDVYRGTVDPRLFRNKIVVVGMTVPTLQDVHPTSASAEHPMSGVEIQANAISTLRRGLPLHEVPRWVVAVLVVVLGMLVPLASLPLGRHHGRSLVVALVGLAAVVGGLYAVIAQMAFGAGLILPVIYPLAALVLSLFGMLAVESVTAAFERERVRDLFSRFVPPSVVDEVIDATDDDQWLSGKRLQSTIVFCDLRDFTSFAEMRTAETVMFVLNLYLREMIEAIQARGGTLLDIQGDGVLAAFGAPIEQLDHADCALDTVRDMVGPRLATLNSWLRDHNLGEGFRIGIGVNSGIIMSGNVGCEWCLQYTAIGDTVNTASRLEKMTKDSPYQVLISDTTRAMLRSDASDLRYVDATSVRGKQVKANLWTIDPNPSAEVTDDSPVSGSTDETEISRESAAGKFRDGAESPSVSSHDAP